MTLLVLRLPASRFPPELVFGLVRSRVSSPKSRQSSKMSTDPAPPWPQMKIIRGRGGFVQDIRFMDLPVVPRRKREPAIFHSHSAAGSNEHQSRNGVGG